MTEPVVLTEQRGPVRIISLNRPQVLNALNAELELALCNALDLAEADSSTRAIVLRGNGRAFCAGADLKERAGDAAPDVDDIVREFRLQSAFTRVFEMETPIIAAVHGYCLGGALQLAGLCDMTILGESAKLGEPEVKFANPLLVPITPHLVHSKQARRLLYLGTIVEADEAIRLGLASEVVPDEALLDRALEVATEIASVPEGGIRSASRALRVGAVHRGLEREAETNAEILALTLESQRAKPERAAFLAAVRADGAGRATAATGTSELMGATQHMPESIDARWEFVRLERIGAAAVISLDRPQVLNAMNRQLLGDFDAAFDRAVTDQASRAVIIRGEGRAFSAGMDLKEPDLLPLPPDGQRPHLAGLLARTMRIWEADKPVIAAVQGHCLGHACDMAAAADFTIAAESAQFAVPEVRHLGGVAAMLYPYLMPAKLVRDFLYRGRPLDAEAALRAGLATTVVPEAELLDAALALATELAAIPVAGLRQMKRAVNRSIDDMGLRGTLAYNLESLALVLNAQPPDELSRREEQIKQGGLGAFLSERDLPSEHRRSDESHD